MVGLSGFEPLTSRLSAVRSSQLSYRPVALASGLVATPVAAPRLRISTRGGVPKERSWGPEAATGGSLKTE
jgi:hypothetical protein